MQNKFEKTSFIILLITIILAPLVFIPTVYAPLDMIKTSFITIGVLLSSIIYFISTLRNREVSIPRHPLFVIGSGIVISILISTILAPNLTKSFFGQGFEIGTASFLLTILLSVWLVIKLTHKNRENIKYIYSSILISFIIVAIFHIVRLFVGPEGLTLGFLHSAVSTVLGKWNDLAIYSALVAIISYISLRFSNQKKLHKILLYLLLAISTFFVFIVNSTLVWVSLVIVFAMIASYEFYINKNGIRGIRGLFKRIPIAALFILIIAVLGVKAGDRLSLPLINKLNLGQAEVVLPWQFTLDIASETIKQSPLFGAGPSRFGSQYLLYKPVYINQTNYWSVEFGNGFSLISNFVVTQGVVGIILWLVFIIVFVYTGYKAIKKSEAGVSRCYIATTFFSASFLWLICLLYIPSHTLLLFTFILTGAFISTLIHEGDISLIKNENINPVLLKFKPLILIVIIIALLLWLAIFVKKVIALTYFYNGISLLNTHQAVNLPKAEMDFMSALNYDRNDTYLQALTEVNIAKINDLAQTIQSQSQSTGKAPDQELLIKITKLIEQGVGYTKDAIKIDPENHYNHLSSARIHSIALTLQVPGAYDETKKAYINASKYNPFDPSIYLNLARIEASQSKVAEAEKYIGTSLQLKQNYLDAIFLLSQIQVGQNKIKDAITSVRFASQINPESPQIFFQLGFLYYNDKDYQSAIEALNAAIKLDKMYANAQYFLGLSYARVNKIQDAIIQFEALTITNPDNQEVKLILSNLRSGKTPFADAKPSIDSKPEKRGSLPIKEKVKTKS